MHAFTLILFSTLAFGSIDPTQVHQAKERKTNSFISDGVFVGGDRSVQEIVVSNVRHSMNSGYERVVVDLKKNEKGELQGMDKTPFYHAAVSKDQGRVVFTLFGNPRLDLNPQAVLGTFKKSKLIKNIDFMPLLEKDRWQFIVELSNPAAVEVFALLNPTRLILDLRKH